MQLTTSFNTRFLHTCGAGALAAFLAACGGSAATTPQLVDARKAYDHAEDSPARTRAPGELADARVALERAEDAHDQNPGSEQEANLARRATRKAMKAQMHGEELASGRTELSAKSEAPRTVVVERETAREPAHPSHKSERRADAALQSLAQVANVKQENRGVVITMSGSLLFPSGDRDVSPIADKSMDQVAHALAQQPNDTTFDIQGYTDSSGSERENQMLSEKRAQAVADRLTEAGIDSSRIKVEGRGEADPIADNATDEGRAANRRVEIVVMHP